MEIWKKKYFSFNFPTYFLKSWNFYSAVNPSPLLELKAMFSTKSILIASIFTILPIINIPWNWKETDKNDKKGEAGDREHLSMKARKQLSESRSLSVRASGGERQTWQTRWLQITNKQSRSDVVITKHPRTQYPVLFHIRSNAHRVPSNSPCADHWPMCSGSVTPAPV